MSIEFFAKHDECSICGERNCAHLTRSDRDTNLISSYSHLMTGCFEEDQFLLQGRPVTVAQTEWMAARAIEEIREFAPVEDVALGSVEVENGVMTMNIEFTPRQPLETVTLNLTRTLEENIE